MAKFLKVGLKPKGLTGIARPTEIDTDHPVFDYHPYRCVLCGKCVHVCQRMAGGPHITFAGRGIDTVISFYGERDRRDSPCRECLACVEICPVAALTLKKGTSSKAEHLSSRPTTDNAIAKDS
jgi:predicted molibdopterin-dependent oxidoreductase YjgC